MYCWHSADALNNALPSTPTNAKQSDRAKEAGGQSYRRFPFSSFVVGAGASTRRDDQIDGSLIKDGALAALCLCCTGAHDARLWMAPLPFQQSADPEPRDFLRTWPTTGKYAP